MSSGEVGCCLSHRQVWEKIHKRQDPLHLICEDDVVVLSDFERVMSEVVIPTDCDIFYLGYIYPGANALGESISEHVHKVNFLFGGYAYILTSKGISKLLKILPIDRPLDNCLGKLTEENTHHGTTRIWRRRIRHQTLRTHPMSSNDMRTTESRLRSMRQTLRPFRPPCQYSQETCATNTLPLRSRRTRRSLLA